MWRILLVIGAVVLCGVAVIVCGPEISKASEEAQKRARRVKEKARKFLKDQLPDELWIEFEKKGHLTIRSKLRSGRTFELHADASAYVVDGQTRKKLCLRFEQGLPDEDKVLTILRTIQANEKGFLGSVGQAA